MQREADIFSFARCGSPCGYGDKKDWTSSTEPVTQWFGPPPKGPGDRDPMGDIPKWSKELVFGLLVTEAVYQVQQEFDILGLNKTGPFEPFDPTKANQSADISERSFVEIREQKIKKLSKGPFGKSQITINADIHYTVSSGENLTTIATKFGVTVEELMLLNGIEEAQKNNLKISQDLIVKQVTVTKEVFNFEIEETVDPNYTLPSVDN